MTDHESESLSKLFGFPVLDYANNQLGDLESALKEAAVIFSTGKKNSGEQITPEQVENLYRTLRLEAREFFEIMERDIDLAYNPENLECLKTTTTFAEFMDFFSVNQTGDFTTTQGLMYYFSYFTVPPLNGYETSGQHNYKVYAGNRLDRAMIPVYTCEKAKELRRAQSKIPQWAKYAAIVMNNHIADKFFSFIKKGTPIPFPAAHIFPKEELELFYAQ